jgi:hypothetical protein
MSKKKKGQAEMTEAERRARFLAKLGESLAKIKKNQENAQGIQQGDGQGQERQKPDGN